MSKQGLLPPARTPRLSSLLDPSLVRFPHIAAPASLKCLRGTYVHHQTDVGLYIRVDCEVQSRSA